MGTVVSLTLPAALGADKLAAATAVVEQLFAGLDETFSLYRPDSEASRLARAEIALPEASEDMRRLYADAVGWRLLTEGAFTPERPDGVLDLSGIVKGYAIQEAGTSLLALGLRDWCLNAGGDVLVSGSPVLVSGSPVPGSPESAGREPWRAGIVDPEDRRTLIAGYPLGGRSGAKLALATSGSAERGDHIWAAGAGSGARPGSAAPVFRQVSVAAADIVTADVLATAIVAGGLPMLDRATDGWDIEVLAVRAGGELLATPGFRR
ncbi:thiamine biosynthesis protein ApbE [Arthrobacter sp. SPG23]|uniref:FAD:protein FMN transferase n=1 Tax=Arthrobacter sp. SPG23 TaxID=1610703 RepID=UPI0005BA88D8|nr:FAD:protein FMN transferase [Arthrobacter sp. SPG23]KIS25571.1 thiamine biosynthesis protein ApbE [Arthrobacter sp. SPG23]